MSHYSKEELELYRHRKMSLLGRLACASHLKTCADCSRRLAELQEEDVFVEELRDSLHAFRTLGKESGDRVAGGQL